MSVTPAPGPLRPPYSQSGFLPYDPEGGFPTAPVDTFKVVYIASGGLAEPVAPRVDEQGSDIIGDGSQLHPLASLWGVFVRYGRLMEEGYHLLIKPGGGLTAQEKLDGVNRWYGQCSSIRQYPTRGFAVMGTEAYVGSWSIEGPLLGAKIPTNLVVTNVQPVAEGSIANNGRSRWRYNQNTGPLPQLGSLMRVRRNGRLVSFEMQVTGVVEDSPGSPNGYIYTDCGNFTNGGVFDVQTTDVVDFITHAAEFIPTSRVGGVDSGVGGADGIGLTGYGAASPFGRLTNGTNVRFTCTMVGFENLTIRSFHGGGFDRCFIYHDFQAFNSSFAMRGCSVNSQTPTRLVDCQFNVQNGPSDVGEQVGHWPSVSEFYDEYEGDLSESDALLLKPINTTTGGVSLYVFYVNPALGGGCIIQGGRFEPRHGATFVGGLIVQGGARFVMQTPEYPVLVRNVHDSGNAAAIWVKSDSVAILGLRNVTMDDVDNHFRVGPYNSAPIALGTEGAGEVGTLREVAGWNGNFSRHLEVNAGGKPTGDYSAIRDFAKFPP